jgi:hypothetical protein
VAENPNQGLPLLVRVCQSKFVPTPPQKASKQWYWTKCHIDLWVRWCSQNQFELKVAKRTINTSIPAQPCEMWGLGCPCGTKANSARLCSAREGENLSGSNRNGSG